MLDDDETDTNVALSVMKFCENCKICSKVGHRTVCVNSNGLTMNLSGNTSNKNCGN